MSNLFVGKFKRREQLTGNYYRIDTLDEQFKEMHFNGLELGDYVLPICNGTIEKLYKFKEFKVAGNGIEASFDVITEYKPELSLIAHIVCCKYFQPDMILLNKAIKSTKNIGFQKLSLENNCPAIEEIDFNKSKRRFFVCLEKKLSDLFFFKPADICIVIDNDIEGELIDIVEFNGQSFNRHVSFWELYQEKIKSGNKYNLIELLDFASPKKDSAPNKENYLKSILNELQTESIFAVDNPVALYDNVIVGRKQYFPTGKSSVTDKAKGTQIETEDEEQDSFESDLYSQYAKLLKFNPNIILYGPPGTGKTYGALRIVEAFEALNGYKNLFKKVINDGRMKFVTFHQAYSYEEFVEGIRPKTDETGTLQYPIEKGVLYELAEACRIQEKKKNVKDEALSNTSASSRVWKVSMGRRYADEHIYKKLRDNNEIAIGFGPSEDVSDWDDNQIDAADNTGMLKYLHSKMAIGDIVFIFNSIRTIRMIGVVVDEYYYNDSDEFGYPHRRKVKWLQNCEENPIDIFDLNQGKQLTLSSLYELKIPVSSAMQLIEAPEDKETQSKPYYLIIDEINRGNIAKIFGELITLIEKDKRDQIPCTLAYSKTEFTLPNNLYLIGTMNTSDRSIALLDTALRRRFAFIEVNPDSKWIDSQHPTIGGHVSPARLVDVINNRIADKLDRDHRIGHSYFMGEELTTKEHLYNVWYYKIFPLLMEYFYNDIKLIGEIIYPSGADFLDIITGEIKYPSLKSGPDGTSEFEISLIKIYESEK